MRENLGTAVRWILVGLVLALLVRQGSGGCSTMVEEGTPAPAFSLPDAAGGPAWTLDSFRGVPVALVFFATWCPTCREEMPMVVRALREAPGTKVLLLSDEDPARVAGWLKGRGFEIPAAGRAGGTWQAYGVRAVPSVVVVGADGNVAYAGQGGTALSQALRKVRPTGPAALSSRGAGILSEGTGRQAPGRIDGVFEGTSKKEENLSTGVPAVDPI